MRTAVVCIGRQENLYAREFVEHYKKLGFSQILIMDNNYDGEEHFEDVLQDHIDQGFVKICDYRNRIKPQMVGYTEMYAKYGNEYDAIMFADMDEFLVLEKDNNISQFISRFQSDWEVIVVNWDCKTDSGLIYYDPRPLMERFKESIPITKCIQYGTIPEDAHVKSIIKGGLPCVRFISNPHVATNPLLTYHASGFRCNNAPWQPVEFSAARLVHFTTKSAEEYCNKLRRGTPDRPYDVFLKTYVGRFWGYNEKTDEKVNYFKEKGYSGV